MARFFVGASAMTTSTSKRTLMKLKGLAAKNYELYEVSMYGAGTIAPADVQHECSIAWATNGGDGAGSTSPTPENDVQNSTVSALTVLVAPTTEPTTYTTNQFVLFSFNQRGGMRWAVPLGMGYAAGGAATQLSIGQVVRSSAAGSVDGLIKWNE